MLLLLFLSNLFYPSSDLFSCQLSYSARFAVLSQGTCTLVPHNVFLVLYNF